MKIDLNNYEEYLLGLIDDELDEEARAALKAFLRAHPDKQKELEMLRKVTLPEEEAIVFPDKQSLYRKAAPAKKVFFIRRYAWLSAAAAACIAVLAIFYFQSPRTGIDAPAIAVNKSTEVTIPPAKQTSVKQDRASTDMAVSKKHEQKREAAPQQEKVEPALAVASPKEKKAAKKNQVPVIDEAVTSPQQHTETVHPVAPVLPRLPATEIAAESPVVSAPVAKIAVENKEDIASPAAGNQAPENKLLATNTSKRNTSIDDKILDATATVTSAKKDVDSTITQKLADLNQKTSGVINNIAKNGIKIGRLTIAFND